MRTDPGALLFCSALAAMVAIRWPFARSWRGNQIVEQHKDLQEKALLFAVSVGGLVLPLVYVFTPWLDFADYRPPRGLIWPGAAVLLGGLGLFWRSHVDLGRHWSPTLELHAEHALITRGVYGRIRHPMYAAAWLWALAPVLLLPNWIAGPAGLLTFGVMYFLRVPREEAMMLERFGEAYRQYLARTPRLWPGLRPRVGVHVETRRRFKC